MHLPGVRKPQSAYEVENCNIVKAKEQLLTHNYYYRSHLKELEIHNESDLDIRERLKQLDRENRQLNALNNELQNGNIELESAFRTLADSGFEEK